MCAGWASRCGWRDACSQQVHLWVLIHRCRQDDRLWRIAWWLPLSAFGWPGLCVWLSLREMFIIGIIVFQHYDMHRVISCEHERKLIFHRVLASKIHFLKIIDCLAITVSWRLQESPSRKYRRITYPHKPMFPSWSTLLRVQGSCCVIDTAFIFGTTQTHTYTNKHI